MVSEVPLNDIVTLVLGTSAMMVMIIAIIGFAFVFQRKLINKERAYRDIEKLLQKQEIRSAYSLIEGQEQERKRIAADIHDNVGNLLATLKIFNDLVLNHEATHEVKRLSMKVGEIADSITLEIRKISHSLDLSMVSNFGLKAAVDHLAEAITNTGKIEFKVHYDVNSPLSNDTSLNIYRIIQELITNTLKHSQATRVRLEISQVNAEITMIFEDNGIGFSMANTGNHGIGLQNIRSRVNHLQGEMKVQSSSHGSSFIVELPNPSHHE